MVNCYHGNKADASGVNCSEVNPLEQNPLEQMLLW